MGIHTVPNSRTKSVSSTLGKKLGPFATISTFYHLPKHFSFLQTIQADMHLSAPSNIKACNETDLRAAMVSSSEAQSRINKQIKKYSMQN
jgi:hypothetical protein